MKRTTTLALVLLLPVIALRSSPAIAQGSARSMDFDVSIRSAGMGGASNAVLWSGGLNHWANPALLGAERGIRGEWGRTHLIPEIADDVIFETHVLKIAGGGAGIVMSGTPFGRGVRLDYGVIEITDPGGNPIGTFEAFEQVNSWGFGVSVFEAIESVTQLRRDGRGPLSRYVDVAFGMNFKDVEVDIAPQIGAQASAMARDWGATLRITPVDVSTEAGTPIRLDAALGISVLSERRRPALIPRFTIPGDAAPPGWRRGALRGRSQRRAPRRTRGVVLVP